MLTILVLTIIFNLKVDHLIAHFVQSNHQSSLERSVNLLSRADHYDIIRENVPLLSNKTLIACVIVREPFVIYNEPAAGSESSEETISNLDNYSGIAIEIIKMFSLIFKFKLKILRPPDNQFGIQTADGKWSGLMGELVNKKSDIGVTALSITINRAQVVDFTRAYYVETATILLRIPGEVQNYFAIFDPFTAGVWLLLSGTILILIFLITIMTRLEEVDKEEHRVNKLKKFLSNHAAAIELANKGKEKYQVPAEARRSIHLKRRLASLSEPMHEFGSSWLDKFYYSTTCVLNIFLNKDIKNPPHQNPIRILVCVWWLSSIVIVNIYFGILFGQLVVPRQPKTIESLEELVNQNQIGWAVTKGSALYELFRQSEPNTVYGQLGSNMQNVTTAAEGVESVITSGTAFIRERSMLTFKMAQEHNRLKECKLQLAKEDFFSVGFGFGLVKNSSYLKPFNSALTLMIEDGFVSRWTAMYWPTKNRFTECGLQPLPEGEPLSMKHFISIYLVCSMIVICSLILLIYQTIKSQLRKFRSKMLLRK